MPDPWVHCKECGSLVLTTTEWSDGFAGSFQIVACPVCGRTERYDPGELDWGDPLEDDGDE